MSAAKLFLPIATVGGVPTLSDGSVDVLCCLSLYLVALLSAAWLHTRLRSYTRGSNAARTGQWKTSLMVTALAAVAAGLWLFIPGSEQVVPNSWRGRGVFSETPPVFVIQPGMAQPASETERHRAIGRLFDAISAGVEGNDWPASRDEIDWVDPELWSVPGIPGYSYKYERTSDGGSVEEPIAGDGTWHAIESGNTRAVTETPDA